MLLEPTTQTRDQQTARHNDFDVVLCDQETDCNAPTQNTLHSFQSQKYEQKTTWTDERKNGQGVSLFRLSPPPPPPPHRIWWEIEKYYSQLSKNIFWDNCKTFETRPVPKSATEGAKTTSLNQVKNFNKGAYQRQEHNLSFPTLSPNQKQTLRQLKFSGDEHWCLKRAIEHAQIASLNQVKKFNRKRIRLIQEMRQ